MSAAFERLSQGRVDAHGRRYVVVLHVDHDLLVYGQSGGFPHRREDGFPDRERRGSRQADEDQVRCTEGRQHSGLFPGEITRSITTVAVERYSACTTLTQRFGHNFANEVGVTQNVSRLTGLRMTIY